MEYRVITADEQDWLRYHQPLLLVKEGYIIEGKLQFFAARQKDDETSRELHLYNHDVSDKGESSYIHDSYQVRIVLRKIDSMPFVRETDGKLISQLLKLGIMNKADGHIYPKFDYVCLATVGEMRYKLRINSTLPFIIENLIIPYFYYHSYWIKFGREPWKGLKHDVAGVLQNFYEMRDKPVDMIDYLRQLPNRKVIDMIIYNIKISENFDCFCGDAKVRDCNCGAMAGYDLIRERVSVILTGNYRENMQFGVAIFMHYVYQTAIFPKIC